MVKLSMRIEGNLLEASGRYGKHENAFFFTQFLNFSAVLRLRFNIQSLVFKYWLVKTKTFRLQFHKMLS